jgi:hypothetical protein
VLLSTTLSNAERIAAGDDASVGRAGLRVLAGRAGRASDDNHGPIMMCHMTETNYDMSHDREITGPPQAFSATRAASTSPSRAPRRAPPARLITTDRTPPHPQPSVASATLNVKC